MGRDLLASAGIDIDKVAAATYGEIRLKYGVTYSDREIASVGYCFDAAPSMTNRLHHSKKLGALGLRAVTIIAESMELNITHYYTALFGETTDPLDDIVVDATYGQHFKAAREPLFVGSRAHMIDVVTKEGRRPELGRLYAVESIVGTISPS